MKNEKSGLNQTDGFEYLERPLKGLVDEFDVCFKIAEEEFDQYVVDPSTGEKSFAEPRLAEPRLVLHVSAVCRSSPNVRHTLQYGLTRSAYGTRLKSIDEAKPYLLKLALPVLESDLGLLKAGKEPPSLKKIIMLRWEAQL